MHPTFLRKIVERPPFVAGRPHSGPSRQLATASTNDLDPTGATISEDQCICFKDPRWATPLTLEEQAARFVAHNRWVKEMKSIPDDPDEDDRDFFRAMDAGREFPLFEDMY